jgi:hypothetical protein
LHGRSLPALTTHEWDPEQNFSAGS